MAIGLGAGLLVIILVIILGLVKFACLFNLRGNVEALLAKLLDQIQSSFLLLVIDVKIAERY